MTRSWACVVWCLALALPAGGCGGSGAGASSDATPGDADSATSDSSDGTGSGDTGSRTGAADGHPGDLGRGGDDDGAADVEAGPPEDVAGDVSDAAATSGSDAGDGQAHADSAQGRGTDVAPDIEEPPPGCVVHADCDDSNVCTEDTCIPDGTGGKKCAHATLACSTPDACLGALCDPVAGCASTLVTSDACCFLGVVAEHDFEGAPGAETTEVLANEGAPPAIWHPSAARAFTGSTSYLFAIPGQGSYDNGNLVAGRLTLPTVELPKNIRTRLRFHVWADVEAGDVWDVLLVHVSDPLAGIDELPMPVWSKNYDNISLGEWTTVDVDLGAFEGRSVNVAFTFNSTDHTFNDTEGVYLDAIWLLAGCDDLTCGDAGDCEDGLPCTAETCDGGWCHYDTSGACCGLDADCFDGDACTVDLCVDFSCDNPPVADADCCNTSDDCDDGNGCTADICQPGAQYKCQHPVIAAAGCCEKTSDCNDQDTCTIDSCEDANCQHINTCCFSDAECDDGDDVCTVDSCVAGACQFAFTGVEGCCETEPWGETFELGADGWSFAGGGGGCQWQVNSGAQAASPPGALWYGAGSNFDCGATSGNAKSPAITLQPGVTYELTAKVWMDTESSSSFDQLELWILGGSGNQKLWSKTTIPMQQWVALKFDLSAFAGETFQLQWRFDTKDSVANDGQGPFVDDMFITSTCTAKACATAAQCNDGLSFTADTCSGGLCEWD